MIDISITICTRNREKELLSCLYSISKQNIKEKIEVLIIDDGDLSKEFLNKSKKILKDFKLNYYKKNNNEKGLFLSRLKAIKLVKGEIILFLDDDVVLNDDYIEVLIDTYQNNSDIIGVGGIDILLPKYSLLRNIYTFIFLYNSLKPGKLSITGLNSSMNMWINKKNIFETEYLNGCNMSFKKEVIKNLPYLKFFNNYSLGEDLFISMFANKGGKLVVNPKLKVKHFQTPIARDKKENVARMKIVNHFKLLKYLNKPKIKYFLIFWTYFGMIVASIVKLDIKELKGYFQGLKELFSA